MSQIFMSLRNRCLLMLLFCIGFLSCTKKYAGYNTNPYGATTDMMDADGYATGKLFPAMINAITPAGDAGSGTDYVNSYQVAYNLAADVYSGHMGQAGDWAGNSNNLTYSFIDGWIAQQLSLNGTLMATWIKIRDITAGSGDSLQFSVAQVLKIIGISKTTDSYGPIPYSAIETGSFTPAFDSQEQIYRSFFPELDKAINILYRYGAAAGKPLGRYDLIFGGDYLKWAKLGNSLKLRLAMRLAYVDPAKARQYAEEAVASPVGLINIAGDNALYQKAASGAFAFKNPLRTLCEDYNEARLGASMQSFLTGYNDPRLVAWFKPSTILNHTTEFVGIRSGVNIVRSSYQPFSRLTSTNDTPLPWLLASEVFFLRAEGTARGWNMGGSAKEFYEAGINAAFAEAGVTMPSGYLTDNSSKPKNYTDFVSTANSITARSVITIQWNEGDNTNTKIERILTQKWIALYGNGQEAWTEFRRTGFPKLFPIPANMNRSGGKVNTEIQVRRLPYPQAQYQQNAVQVNKAVATMLGGPDTGGTPLWWNK
jgi:hypothetical protein